MSRLQLIEDLRHPIQQRVTAASKAEDRTRRLEATRIKLRLNECKVELDEKVRAQEFAEVGAKRLLDIADRAKH